MVWIFYLNFGRDKFIEFEESEMTITIETERLVLRRFREEDIPDLLEVVSDLAF